MVKDKHFNEKNLNISIVIKCSAIAVLILFGLNIPYLNIAALLLACWFIFRGSITEILGILLFTLAFSPIFKLQSGGNTFFNFLILVTILKLLFNRNLKFSYKELIVIIVFTCYALIFGGMDAMVGAVDLVMYFVLLLLIFKQNKIIQLRSILLFFSLGIILASVAGLFSDYIPGLSSFINQARLKLEPGEYFIRFSGIQSNPNHFTMDISIALAGWFGLVVSGRAKPFDYILIIMLSIFGIMSLSKSFLVIYLVLLLIVLIIFGKQSIRGLIKGVFIVGIVISAVYIFVDKEYINAFLGRILVDNSSSASLSSVTTGRYDIWMSYIGYIFSDIKVLLFGEGLGAEVYASNASHSYILETIYYLGFIGASIYIICIINILPKRNLSVKRSLVNYLPLIILIVRGMAINLIFRENIFFYFIIIAVTLNTNLNIKDRLNFVKIKNSS
ncbi:hypothetical protein LJR015_000491 [Peribacillus frigoritolerans]|uniref:hypothetical protein n=1 Tax=Peribacillus frigoritolerans TaxID=450367 RepID=UPI003ECC689D